MKQQSVWEKFTPSKSDSDTVNAIIPCKNILLLIMNDINAPLDKMKAILIHSSKEYLPSSLQIHAATDWFPQNL